MITQAANGYYTILSIMLLGKNQLSLKPVLPESPLTFMSYFADFPADQISTNSIARSQQATEHPQHV